MPALRHHTRRPAARRPHLLAAALAASFALAACSDSPSAPAKKPDPDPDPDPLACTGQPAGPTLHTNEQITATTRWTRCGNPHIVVGEVRVDGPNAPVLILDTGVVVRFRRTFGPTSRITVGYIDPGALVVRGTAADPVTMESDLSAPAKGDWIGIVLMSETDSARLEHLTMRHCGANPSLAPGLQGCVIALGPGGPSTSRPLPVVRDVLIEDGSARGVVLAQGAAFGAGSANLTVRRVDSYPVALRPEAAGSLPAGGSYTQNGIDGILLTGYGVVGTQQTWADPGVPYVLETSGTIDVAGPTGPALTLAAGVTLRMGADAVMRVGYLDAGRLLAAGTAARPVSIISDVASPAPGAWRTIYVAEGGSGTEFHHVTMSHCGANASLGAFRACVTMQGTGGNAPGSLSALFDHVTITNSAAGGVTLLDGAAFAPGSTTLSVTNGGSYPVVLQPDVVGTLPAGGTYSGNTPNMILLHGYGVVSRSQSWINPGVPYVVESSEMIDVADPSSPVLTLAPGTTIRMGPNSRVRVGYVYPGAVVAQGTALAPITFTADTPTPTPAFWVGWEVAAHATAATRLDYVTIEYGGGFNGYSPGDPTNLLSRVDLGPYITHSTLRFSSGCGISRARYVGENPPFTTDFTAGGLGNTFANNPKGAQCGPY